MVSDVIVYNQLGECLQAVPDSEEGIPGDGGIDAVRRGRGHFKAVALV